MPRRTLSSVLLSDQVRAIIQAMPGTAYELSKQSEVHRSQISRFMNGHTSLNMDALDRIAQVLELRIISVRRANKPLAKTRAIKTPAEPAAD